MASELAPSAAADGIPDGPARLHHAPLKLARRLAGSAVVRGSAAALSIKLGGSVLGFAMFALAAHQMDAAAFGSVAVVFNAMSFLAVVALCGQETLIVRSWDEYRSSGRPDLARGALRFGVRVVLSVGFAMAIVVACGWLVWDPTVPTLLPLAATSFLFAQSVMNFSGQFSRVAAGIVVGDSPREVVWRVLTVAAILALTLTHQVFTAADFFFIAALSIAVAVAFQAGWVARLGAVPEAIRRAVPKGEPGIWLPRAVRMWMSSILDTSGQYLEVIIIGLFLGPADAAFYFVCTRITNVFAMISAATTAYATSRISALFHGGERAELQRILKALALISLVLAVGAIAIIFFAGHLLLWVFGAEYVAAYPALLILAAGSSMIAFVGPAGYLLLLTGHEGVYPRILGGALVVRFALIAVLAPAFGLIGATVAWSIAATAMTISLAIACRRLVHLDPSVVSLFRGGKAR